MSNLADIAITAILSAIPDAVAEVSYAGTNADLVGTITDALATGIDQTRVSTEQGLYDGGDGAIRYAASDEPDEWAEDPTSPAIMGQLLDVTFAGATDATRVRVSGRLEMAGGVRLSVVSAYEEQ